MPRCRGCRAPVLALALAVAASAASPPVDEAAGAAPLLLAAQGKEETTAPPSETETPEPAPETTAAPYEPDKSPVSIIETTLGELRDALLTTKYQYINAIVALLFGLVMVFDGEAAFKWIVLGATFVICNILGMSEVSKLWHRDVHVVLRNIIGCELGLLGAFAAWQGYQGMLVAIGSCLGAATSSHLVDRMEYFFGPVDQYVTTGVYSVVMVGFLVLVQRGDYVRFLKVMCPFFGGSLVVSSCSFLATLIFHVAGYSVSSLTPAGHKWIEFLLMLWSGSAKDVGLLAGHTFHVPGLGQEWQLDRVVGYAWWVIVFLVGVLVQCRSGKRPARKVASAARGAAAAAAGPPPGGTLQEPLLVSNDTGAASQARAGP